VPQEIIASGSKTLIAGAEKIGAKKYILEKVG
jgi:hypothetical protein